MRAAIFEIRGNAGRTKCVTANSVNPNLAGKSLQLNDPQYIRSRYPSRQNTGPNLRRAKRDVVGQRGSVAHQVRHIRR
jgi:hypothetical protein